MKIAQSASLSADAVDVWLDDYTRAWKEQDTELVLSLFTSDVIYQGSDFNPPRVGHESLRAFWTYQVRDYQRDISVSHQLWGTNGHQAMVNYHASFTWLPISGRLEINGVWRLSFEPTADGRLLCSHFEEWLHSRET